MKTASILCITLALILAMSTCLSNQKKEGDPVVKLWGDYNVGVIDFVDEAPHSEGSRIYNSIIPDVETYIQEQARLVLTTLYSSPEDNVIPVDTIRYLLQDRDGISAKSGNGNNVEIFYSTRYIEKAFEDKDTANLLFETRGVLLHELTHAYQLEPQGIGSYGTNRMFWVFIEGMADAVRVANGGFGENARPIGGNYMDGYRTTGYFLVWVKENKDSGFLRKFNSSTQHVVPWSFDGAIKYVLGEGYDIDELWREYQIAVGDI